MRIVIPILGFGRTGGYRVLSRVASEWTSVGHDVLFLSPRRSTLPYHPTTAHTIWLDDDGTSAERSDEAPPRGVGAVPRNLRALRAGLDRYAADADLIIANHSLTAWPVALSRVSAVKGYYVQAYEPEYFTAAGLSVRGAILRMLAVGSYQLPLRRVANSPIYRRYKALRTEAFVPPGIDFAVFSPAAEPRPRDGALIIGTIGRSEADKGTRYALDAFRELRARGRDVRMLVAYGGLEEQDRLTDGLTLTIPANDGELADYYRSLDVLVAPGLVQHGAPHYPVMEGMACGIPIVTTGYLPATSENAWIVPTRDAASIADAIDSIATDREGARARAQRGREAVAEYQWPLVADRLLRAFLEAQ